MKIETKLAFARGISEFGNAFRYITLSLVIGSIHNDPKDIGIAEILETLGLIGSGIVVPFFIDKMRNEKKSLYLADVFSFLLSVLFFMATKYSSLSWLFFGAFAMNFISGFYMSSLSLATSRLTKVDTPNSEHKLRHAFSKLIIFNYIGAILGSISSSGAIRVIPIEFLFLIDGASFLLSALLISQTIKSAHPIPGDLVVPPYKSFTQQVIFCLDQWKLGAEATFKNKSILFPILSQSLIGTCAGIFSACIVGILIFRNSFSQSLVTLGIGSNRIWGILGIVFLNCFKHSNSRLLKVAPLVLALSSVAMYFFNEPIAFFTSMGLYCCCMTLISTTNQIEIISLTDPAVQGRVIGFRYLSIDLFTVIGNLIAVGMIANQMLSETFLVLAIFGLLSSLTYAIGHKYRPTTPI